MDLENVTPNVFTTTKLRGCNPSFVVTSAGVVVIDTPQLPTKAVAMLLGDPKFKQGIVDRIPLGRVGETKDIVGPAIFLVSDAASFVTGQVLGIDGGLTATQ